MLLKQILSRENMLLALKRVEQNKGSHGVDMMPVQNLRQHIVENWPSIKEAILKGTYEPMPVRRVEIPKPDGGVRLLGIPTVTRLRQLLGKQMSRKSLYDKGLRDKNGILIVLLAFWLDFQNFRRQIHAHFLEYLFLFGGWCRCPIKISIICGEMTNVKPLDFTTY